MITQQLKTKYESWLKSQGFKILNESYEIVTDEANEREVLKEVVYFCEYKNRLKVNMYLDENFFN